VRLDRKLLLIAPTIVLLFVFAGMIYTAMQLRVLGLGSDSLKERSAYIAAVERGEKRLDAQKAVGLIRISLEVEAKRTAAIAASRDLLVALSAAGLISVLVLAVGIRSVPREHWPRFAFERSRAES
jgi:hypothetical protein